jgi:hypothetical protein
MFGKLAASLNSLEISAVEAIAKPLPKIVIVKISK